MEKDLNKAVISSHNIDNLKENKYESSVSQNEKDSEISDNSLNTEIKIFGKNIVKINYELETKNILNNTDKGVNEETNFKSDDLELSKDKAKLNPPQRKLRIDNKIIGSSNKNSNLNLKDNPPNDNKIRIEKRTLIRPKNITLNVGKNIHAKDDIIGSISKNTNQMIKTSENPEKEEQNTLQKLNKQTTNQKKITESNKKQLTNHYLKIEFGNNEDEKSHDDLDSNYMHEEYSFRSKELIPKVQNNQLPFNKSISFDNKNSSEIKSQTQLTTKSNADIEKFKEEKLFTTKESERVKFEENEIEIFQDDEEEDKNVFWNIKKIFNHINIQNDENSDREWKKSKRSFEKDDSAIVQQSNYHTTKTNCVFSKIHKGKAIFVSSDDIIFSTPIKFLPTNPLLGNSYRIVVEETEKINHKISKIQNFQKKILFNLNVNDENND